MTPSLADRAQAAHDEVRRRFVPREPKPADAPAGPVAFSAAAGIDAANALTVRLWREDRERRIRAGVCRRCGERTCPTVGGKDKECVP